MESNNENDESYSLDEIVQAVESSGLLRRERRRATTSTFLGEVTNFDNIFESLVKRSVPEPYSATHNEEPFVLSDALVADSVELLTTQNFVSSNNSSVLHEIVNGTDMDNPYEPDKINDLDNIEDLNLNGAIVHNNYIDLDNPNSDNIYDSDNPDDPNWNGVINNDNPSLDNPNGTENVNISDNPDWNRVIDPDNSISDNPNGTENVNDSDDPDLNEVIDPNNTIDLNNPNNAENAYDSDNPDDPDWNGVTDGKGNQEEESVNNNTVNENVINDKSNRKRKGMAEPHNWKAHKNKSLREQGESYLGWSRKNNISKHNTERKERKLGPTCTSTLCRKSKVKNCNLILQSEREDIHRKFWHEMSWEQKKVYVSSLVSSTSKKRKTVEGESRRSNTLKYSLNVNGQIISVCKKMFLSTLSLKEWSVNKWAQSNKHGIHPSKQVVNNQRLSLKDNSNSAPKQFLVDFLKSLPKLPSHYCRRDTKKLYLEPIYGTVTDLFVEYRKKCADTGEKSLSRFSFDSVMREENISLFIPKKDQCDTCCSFKSQNISEEVYKTHCLNKEKAREEKHKDISDSTKGACIVLEQDLQAVKICPLLKASALYYKRKLCCHNFTIYNLSNRHARCYWFNETESDLCASTFASCLIDYLTDTCSDTSKEIIIWSDGCGYQNKNAILSNALLSFSIEKNVTIYQKYLEPGHTQMEADSVHAHIEKKLKNKEIYIPSDYDRITKEARKNPGPYEVKHVEHDFFSNFAEKKYLKYESIRPGKKPHEPTVSDVKVIKYTSNGLIQVKLDFSTPFIDIPSRPKNIILPAPNKFPKLHKSPLKITYLKWKNLQELKQVIPKDCHSYYDNLPHEEK